MQHLFVLAAEKRQRFFANIRATRRLREEELVRIAADKGYSLSVRSAALRNLVTLAPVEVTLGRPFAQRRRLVREHYGI